MYHITCASSEDSDQNCVSDQSYQFSFPVPFKPMLGRIQPWKLGNYDVYMKSLNEMETPNKGKRKVQGVPQSQTAALPRHQEEEEADNTKQAQIQLSVFNVLFASKCNLHRVLTDFTAAGANALWWHLPSPRTSPQCVFFFFCSPLGC